MIRRAILFPVLALVAAAAVAAFADRETAQFSTGRGDKALAAKKWDEAEGLYRKALEEDPTFLPARYGLAQALLGEGKNVEAIDELRKFADDVRAAASAPADWKTALAKADKQIAEMDASGAALKKIQDAYADALVDFAQRWMSKDPTTAERALRRALKIHPGFVKAVQALDKAKLSTASEVVDLFDGKSVNGWSGADAPMWTLDDGTLVGTVNNGAYIVHSLRDFNGDFTVRCEARVIDEYAEPVLFAFMPCYKADHDYYLFGLLRGKLLWSDEQGPQKTRDVASVAPPALKKPFDPKQWNTYELRCWGSSSVALVNGDEIGREERPEWRRGGFVGLKIQNVKVAFRKIQVDVR